jgi:hypothetical protein
MQSFRRMLLAVACVLPSFAQAQPARVPAVALAGPDGAMAAGIEQALLAPWRARGGSARYTAVPPPQPVYRLLGAGPAAHGHDLALLDPLGAAAALARGLVVALPPGSVATAEHLPLPVRAATAPCVPIGFDALLVAASPVAERGGNRTRPYLVALMAQAEAADWRDWQAGLARLARIGAVAPVWRSEALRAVPALQATPPAEGIVLQPLLLCLAAGAANLRAALTFADFALQPDRQAALAVALRLAPARPGVTLPAEWRARLPDPWQGAAPALLPDAAGLAQLRARLAAHAAETLAEAAPVVRGD